MSRIQPRSVPCAGAPGDEASLLPLWIRLEYEYIRRIRKWDLPYNVAVTLLHLYIHADISEPAGLAEATGLPRQTMTFILDTLEARRLAARHPHPKDRRRKLIQLSVKGRKTATALYADLLAFEAEGLRPVPADQRLLLRRMILRFIEQLHAINLASGSGRKESAP